MAKLVWDNIGEREYEVGCDRCVLYPINGTVYDKGYAWNGLTSVTESPSGAEATPLYANNSKYVTLRSTEDFGATVEAYTYPDQWAECDGSAAIAKGVMIGQQSRKTFGLAYRTMIGNDTEGTDHGYKLHLIYGATATPSQKQYGTITDSPEAMTLSWELSTVPVPAPEGFKPTASVTIDSNDVDADELAALEAILYGSESAEPRLPLPAELVTLFPKGALGA